MTLKIVVITILVCTIAICLSFVSQAYSSYSVADKIELGHYLFFDKDLSYDRSISCSTCHNPGMSFSDGYKVSLNGKAEPLQFNSPSLINVKDRPFFSWGDTTINTLHKSVDRAFKSKNPIELGFYISESQILNRINNKYKLANSHSINISLVKESIVKYLELLESRNSHFDKYIQNENYSGFTEKMKKGKALFDQYNCNVCHGGVDFDQHEENVLLTFYNNPESKYNSSNGLNDLTGIEKDSFLFRIPSLRNLCNTAPYFHNGSASSLGEAIDYHALYMRSADIPKMKINDEEKYLIIHFLHSLCEFDFDRNYLFEDPFSFNLNTIHEYNK